MLFWYWLIILRAGAQQRKYLTRFLFYTLALVTRTCSNISIIHLINLSFTGREVSLPCSFRSTRCLWFDSFDINAVIYLFSWELVWNQLHRSITAIYSKHTQRHIPSNLTFFSIFFWIDRNLTFCRRSIPTTDELFQKGVDDDTTIGKTILLNQLRKQNDTTKIYLLRDNTAILQLRGHLRDDTLIFQNSTIKVYPELRLLLLKISENLPSRNEALCARKWNLLFNFCQLY